MLFLHVTWISIIALSSMVISDFIFDDDEYGEKRTFGDPRNLIKRSPDAARVHISTLRRGKDFTNLGPLCSYKIERKGKDMLYKASEVTVSGGCTKIHIQSFLNNHFGGKNLQAIIPIINGNNFEVDKVVYNTDTKLVTLKARSTTSMVFFGGGGLSFGEDGDNPLNIQLEWTESDDSSAWVPHDIEIILTTDKVTVGSTVFKFRAKKAKTIGDVFEITKFESQSEGRRDVIVKDVVKAISGLSQTALTSKFSQKFARLRFKDFKGHGEFTTNEDYYLVLYPSKNGGRNRIFGREKVRDFIIMTNPENIEASFITYMVQFIDSSKMLTSLNGLITTNINADEGITNRINTKEFCFSISSGEYNYTIKSKKDEPLMKDCFPAEWEAFPNNPDKAKVVIPNGMSIYVQINYKANIIACNDGKTSPETSGLPEKMTLTATVKAKGVFSFGFPEGAKGPAKAVLKCSSKGASLPPQIPFFDTDIVKVTNYVANQDEQTVTLQITPAEKWRTIPVIELSFHTLEFIATHKKENSVWELSGSADMKIHGIAINIKLEYSQKVAEENPSDEDEEKKEEPNKDDNNGGGGGGDDNSGGDDNDDEKRKRHKTKMLAKLRKRKSIDTQTGIFNDLSDGQHVSYDNMIIPRVSTASYQNLNPPSNITMNIQTKKDQVEKSDDNDENKKSDDNDENKKSDDNDDNKDNNDEKKKPVIERQWTFTAKMPRLIAGDIFKLFHPNSKIQKSYPALFENGIKDLEIKWAWGNEFEARFKGKLVIMGWDKISVECVLWKQQPNNEIEFGLGLHFGKINVDEMLSHILSDDSISVPWLSNLEAKLVIGSAQGMKDISEPDKKEDGGQQNPKKNRSSSKKDSKKKLNAAKSKSKSIALSRNNDEMQRNVSNKLIEKRALFDDEEEKKNDVKFTLASLAGVDIIKGVGFEMTWSRPTDKEKCLGDSLCKFIYEKVAANTKFIFAGAVESDGITISAELKDAAITLTEDLKLNNAKLKIEAKADGGIELSCELIYDNKNVARNPLTFIGSIEVGFAGELKFRFTIVGRLEYPFGFSKISFQDVMLGAAFDFAKGSVLMEFGVTVLMGRLDKNPISIKGYFGLSPSNWIESWVYVKASKLTLGELGRVFEFDVPEDYKDEGFPEGFEFSLSRKKQEIESLGIKIPAGLTLIGKFKFLFIELNAKCSVDTRKKALDIYIEMNKQDWLGGMIQISSSVDETKGPLFHLKRDEKTPLEVKIDGMVSVLGLTTKVFIKIEKNIAKLDFSGTPFPFLFDARLEIDGHINREKREFDGGAIKITVTTSTFLPKLIAKINSWLDFLKSDVEESKKESDSAVSIAETDSKKIENKKSLWEQNVDNWRKTLEAKQKKLQAKQNEISQQMSDCYAQCEDVCVPFFDWRSDCFSLFGWTFPCPYPNACAAKAPNIFCYAGCALTNMGSAFITWIQSTLTKLQLALQTTMLFFRDVLVGIGEGIQKLHKFIVKAKDYVLTKIQDGLNYLVQLLTKDIHLRKLILEAKVQPPFTYCLGFEIDIHLFGYDLAAKAEFCLFTMIRDLIYYLFSQIPGLEKTFSIEDAVEKLKENTYSIKQANKDLKESADTVEKEVDVETAKKFEDELTTKRSLPTTEMFRFIDEKSKDTVYSEEHQKIMDIPHEMPAYEIHNDEMLENLEIKSPWVAVNSFEDNSNNLEPKQMVDHKVVKRSLSFGDESKPCNRLKRSLATYDTIANVLLRSARNLEKMQKNHVSHQEFHRNEITKLDKRIAELEMNNLTDNQREDAYFWYHKANHGYEDFHNKVRRNIDYHNDNALPILHNQLNYVLSKSGKEGGFIKHVEDMHKEAMDDFKRSINNEEEQMNGQKLLNKIKKGILNIVTDENTPLSRFARSIDGMKNDISHMNKIAAAC